jgi:uncharacterized protein (UPF0264 family)
MIGAPWSRGRSPGLLVSVRSAEEAREAVRGGASIIDIKEPDRGPLGRASSTVWQAVRQVVPHSIPVSVALGELAEWQGDRDDFDGISFRKLGLAGTGSDWMERWAEVRQEQGGLARWVAVAYADWASAGSPRPLPVLEAAIEAEDCSGILLDTWDKSKRSSLGPTVEWKDWVNRAQRAGRFVALAGSLDCQTIVRLSPLKPDLFAVRGAACERGDRRSMVRAERVAELVQAIDKSRP